MGVGVPTAEICCLTALKAGRLGSRCRKGRALSEVCRGGSSRPLLSFWWWLVVFGVPWLIAVSLESLPRSHDLLPLCVSESQTLSSSKDTSRGLGRTLIQYDLISIAPAKILFLNKVIFTGTRGQDLSKTHFNS